MILSLHTWTIVWIIQATEEYNATMYKFGGLSGFTLTSLVILLVIARGLHFDTLGILHPTSLVALLLISWESAF